LFDVKKPIVENYLSWLCHQVRGFVDARIDNILNKDNYVVTSACKDPSIDVLIEKCYFFQNDHVHTFNNINFIFFKYYQYTNAPNHKRKIKAHAHMVRIV
jgi:hypothetical protein